jgi:hypothetical protein
VENTLDRKFKCNQSLRLVNASPGPKVLKNLTGS